MRLFLHAIAIILESIGTLFLFLNAQFMEAKFPSINDPTITFNIPKGFEAWYYRCSTLGFALLFLGILSASCCLWLEHFYISRSSKSNEDTQAKEASDR